MMFASVSDAGAALPFIHAAAANGQHRRGAASRQEQRDPKLPEAACYWHACDTAAGGLSARVSSPQTLARVRAGRGEMSEAVMGRPPSAVAWPWMGAASAPGKRNHRVVRR